MSGFRTFHTAERGYAVPMQPVVDPADWTSKELGDLSTWSYSLTDSDRAELKQAVARFRKTGKRIEDVDRDTFELDALGHVLDDVLHELIDGRGIVMMRNFPIERFDREGGAIAYLGLGAYLGRRMSQNKHGHILGHVKDLGGDYRDPNTRGYMTNAEMRFHADGCDYVGLLCLQTPMSGGESRVASSVTVYNTHAASGAPIWSKRSAGITIVRAAARSTPASRLSSSSRSSRSPRAISARPAPAPRSTRRRGCRACRRIRRCRRRRSRSIATTVEECARRHRLRSPATSSSSTIS